MYQFQPALEVSDFSGGMTDNYIDTALNRFQIGDNLLIEKNKKLLSRNGTIIYDVDNEQIPAGNQRVGVLFKHPADQLFVQSARNLYYIASGSFNTLQGPADSNPAFSANATTNYVSFANWQNHTYLTSNSFADTIKVYKDSSSTFRVNTAGLPEIELEGAIDLANAIRTAYIAHIADASEHTTAADTVNTISAAAAHDFDSLVTLVTELLVDYDAHEADAELGAAWAYHEAQEASDHSLSSIVAPKTLTECLTKLDDLRTKFQAHDADGTAHGTGAQHQLTAFRVPQFSVTGSDGTYLYKFVYSHTYTVGDVTFKVFGPTSDSISVASNAPGTINISQIPVISNGSTRCYDTATIKVEVYRTIVAGTQFYYVGEVDNGTTTFADTVTDANLQLNILLYTEGGVQSNNPPPKAKYVHVVNDIAWYCNVKEGTVNYNNRIRPSKPGSPDSCPEENAEDVEDAITGISSVNYYPIVFCRNRAYRLEGIIDELGRGVIEKRDISRTDGCISHLGIVQIPQGLVFPGEDQFYFTDGYSIQGISNQLIETYKDIVETAGQEPRIYGKYDSINNRVYWAVTTNSSNSDNDKIFVLDLTWGISEESTFTTISNVDSWRPTSLEIQGGDFVIGDSRGYLFKFDANSFTDPDIDTAVAASSWNTNAMIWDYKGFASTFGSISLFKFIPSITLQAKNQTNATIQIKSNNDDGGNFKNLKEIRFRNNITWGDPEVLWNSPPPDYLWNVAPVVKSLRLFPQGRRCIYKQIEVTNAYTIIYNSDSLSTADVDSTAKTVTLTDIAISLPSDIVNYFISFESDGYANEFVISVRNSATQLTFLDNSNLSEDITAGKWEIKGYRKGEVLNLLSYGINWAPVPQHQEVWRGVTGGNA